MRFFINILFSYLLCGPSFAAVSSNEKVKTQDLTHVLEVTEAPQNAADYFWEKIVQPAQKKEFAYQEIHGNLETASIIIGIFSSLACPMCAELHLQALPEILNSQELLNGELAVICRDYPADPLSLHASAAVWTLPEKAQEFRKQLFEKSTEDVWTRDLKQMKDLVLSFCGSEEEKLKITSVMNDTQKSLMKKIFAQRSSDKEPLGIHEVPVVLVYSVPNKKLFTLKSFLDLIKVLQLFKKPS